MSAHDHRITAGAAAGAAAASAAVATCCPGSRASGRPCARRSGSRIARPAGRGLRAHLRRRAARAGHARGARRARRGARAGDVLPGRRAGAAQSRARARDRRRRARGRRCTATATATCCGSRRGRCARTSPRAQDAIAARPAAPVYLYRPPYGVLNAAALRYARATRLAHRCCGAHWGRDWEAGASAESIAARVTHGARRGLGAAAARRRRLLGAGLLAAHRRGAAARARGAARARPRAGAPVSGRARRLPLHGGG